MQFKYFSIKEIQKFFIENDLSIIKSKGQNFLINSGAVDAIINNAGITPDDLVIEIGCGLGSLTYRILETGCTLIGFEIDRAYVRILKEQFDSFSNFNLVQGDFLKNTDKISSIAGAKKYNRVIFIGNLPYSITTPIIEKIYLTPLYFDDLIFMVQKEVGQRITAVPGTKQYGSLSIFCQFYSEPKIILNLTPRSFYPSPKVESIVVQFKKKTNSYTNLNKELFFKIVRSLFMNRRKQLKNNLLMSPLLLNITEDIISKALFKLGIPPTVRGEVLTIDQIKNLTDELDRLMKSANNF
jgi:16S rRNA (adenine1518-N6/adenine1519-N6)-dimethyltransferase